MKQLGRERQVLAVTHLAQVAACADQHLVVTQGAAGSGRATSDVQPVTGEARVAESRAHARRRARLGTSLAHAQATDCTRRRRPAPAAAQDATQP